MAAGKKLPLLGRGHVADTGAQARLGFGAVGVGDPSSVMLCLVVPGNRKRHNRPQGARLQSGLFPSRSQSDHFMTFYRMTMA